MEKTSELFNAAEVQHIERLFNIYGFCSGIPEKMPELRFKLELLQEKIKGDFFNVTHPNCSKILYQELCFIDSVALKVYPTLSGIQFEGL